MLQKIDILQWCFFACYKVELNDQENDSIFHAIGFTALFCSSISAIWLLTLVKREKSDFVLPQNADGILMDK